MEESTVSSIMAKLSEWAAAKAVVPPQTWMDAASKLNALLQGEQEKLVDMRSEIAKVRAAFLTVGKTAAFAKAQVEALPEFALYEKQKVLVERALEQILLAKKNATLASELMRHHLD